MKKVFSINSEDLISEQKFNPIIHDFLVKCLKRDTSERLGPEEIPIFKQKLATQLLSNRKSLISSSSFHLKSDANGQAHKRRRSSVGRTSTHGSNQS